MNRLDKKQEQERGRIALAITEARDRLEANLGIYNEKAKALFDEWVRGDLDKLNEAIEEAREFAEGVVGEIEGYMDERSDKWREGDRGAEYESWKDEWDSFVQDAEAVSVDPPESIDMPDGVEGSRLEELPESPG